MVQPNKTTRVASIPRSTSRRERRSDAARKPVVHVVMPGMEVARAEIKPRETITAFLRRAGWAIKDKAYGWQFKKGLPTVLEINGECVLRKNWRTTRIVPRTIMSVCAVGGFAQLTTVTADAVTSRIVHRWPDEIGKPVLSKPFTGQ